MLENKDYKLNCTKEVICLRQFGTMEEPYASNADWSGFQGIISQLYAALPQQNYNTLKSPTHQPIHYQRNPKPLYCLLHTWNNDATHTNVWLTHKEKNQEITFAEQEFILSSNS